jgi:hypothetical protein
MRFLLPIIGIGVLIVTWYALEIRFAPRHVADARASVGIPVYDLHVNKRDVQTLPEEEIPLP